MPGRAFYGGDLIFMLVGAVATFVGAACCSDESKMRAKPSVVGRNRLVNGISRRSERKARIVARVSLVVGRPAKCAIDSAEVTRKGAGCEADLPDEVPPSTGQS